MKVQNFRAVAIACVLAAFSLATPSAQSTVARETMTIDGDNVTIRGCVRNIELAAPVPSSLLFWSRNNIVITGAAPGSTPVGTSGSDVASRVFYWIDDVEALSKHLGMAVEVKGDLEDFERGELDVDRDGDMTSIEIRLDDKKETVRVPTTWLRGTALDRDRELDIVARRIEVNDVRVIGACRP